MNIASGNCAHSVPAPLFCGACDGDGQRELLGIEATLAERGARYGSFTDHARIAQAIKAAMADSRNWATLADDQRECLEMLAHKIGRILNGDPDYHDSWHDIVGYTKLVADRLVVAVVEEEAQPRVEHGVTEALAFLRERADAARRLADKHKDDPDALLADRARQLDVIIADIEAGFHLPDAPAVAERSAAEPITDAAVVEEEAQPRVEHGATGGRGNRGSLCRRSGSGNAAGWRGSVIPGPAIHVTAHAIDRYRERIAAIDPAVVVERLTGPVFVTACTFGARLVKLPEGGTAVLNFTPDGPSVVTVMGKTMRGSLHFPESHGGRPPVGKTRGL